MASVPGPFGEPGLLRTLATRRMWVAAALGFSSGLPLLLTAGPLQAWFREAGVSVEAVGLMALLGLPYTLKFLWAPAFDRFSPPFLGRRRGWLLIAQSALAAAIFALAASDPARAPATAAALALAVAFLSASQDIVVDAHRREDLRENELGLGSALYVYGYRTGMLLSSAGGLVLADRFSFAVAYRLLGLCMLVGVATTLIADEPSPPPRAAPLPLRAAVLEPLREYFSRRDSLWILLFVVLYKLGDSMASWMATPFYLELGFTKTEIGALANFVGYGAVLAGMFLGGAAILRLGLFRALWSFGILQAVSTLGFAVLAAVGPNRSVLAAVIGFENVTGGMGTAAYMAFLASLTDKKFTATQYALLTSLMGIPRVVLSAPTGLLASRLGWTAFFGLCSAIALPGLVLLRRFRPWLVRAHEESSSLAEVTQRTGRS